MIRCCKCDVQLPEGRKLRKCNPCQRSYWRQWRSRHLRPTREFPGVDIDAIYFNGWKAKQRPLSKTERATKYKPSIEWPFPMAAGAAVEAIGKAQIEEREAEKVA